MSDFDGDLVFTTSQPEFINRAKGGNPISYEKKSATKTLVTDEESFNSDLQSMNCKVGFVTNVSSTYHAMVNDYPIGSPEREEIEKRLKALRREQGNTIDAGKGILVDPFPQHWVKFQKQSDDIDDSQRELENRIIADKRPLFFIHLYSSYKKKYNKEVNNFDFFVRTKYGISFEEFVALENKTAEQQQELQRFYDFSFFIWNDCVMNKVSRHIQNEVKTLREESKRLFYDWSFLGVRNETHWVEEYCKLFSTLKRQMKDADDFSSVEQIAYYIRKQIDNFTSDFHSAAKDVFWYVYIEKKGQYKDFAWKVFGSEMAEILSDVFGELKYPRKDPNGKVEYLYQKYSFETLSL